MKIYELQTRTQVQKKHYFYIDEIIVLYNGM